MFWCTSEFSYSGIIDSDACNDFVVTTRAKNITCPHLLSSGANHCNLGSGDHVEWCFYGVSNDNTPCCISSQNDSMDCTGLTLEFQTAFSPPRLVVDPNTHQLVIEEVTDAYGMVDDISCSIVSMNPSNTCGGDRFELRVRVVGELL